MGSVKRASPCMVPTSSSQLPRSSLAAPILGPQRPVAPAVLPSVPFLKSSSDFPICPAPAISHIPSPVSHPLGHNTIRPAVSPCSSSCSCSPMRGLHHPLYIPIRYTRTYAPRSRPDHAPHGRCAYLGGRSMACFCRQVASLARLISTVTLHPLERGSWHRGLVSAASPWARTIWPPAVSSPEQDDVPFQTPLAARQPARERPYSHTRPSTLP